MLDYHPLNSIKRKSTIKNLQIISSDTNHPKQIFALSNYYDNSFDSRG